MPQHIILSCSYNDAVHITPILKLFNPSLTISTAPDRAALDVCLAAAPPDVRLIGFCTQTIIPKEILERLPGPSYNIHPGPPEYPGRHPIIFALYDKAEHFGATAHEMIPKIDSGQIVGVVTCKVPAMADIAYFRTVSAQCSFQLFLNLAPAFANSPTPLGPIPLAWGPRRCSQNALEALRAVPSDIDAPELERRIAAFGAFPDLRLHTSIQGRRFELVL